MNAKPLFTRFGGDKNEKKSEVFEMMRMATVTSFGRTSTKNLGTDKTKQEDLRSMATLKDKTGVILEEGLTKGKKYNYQEADEEVILPGKQGQTLKPVRIINQHLVKNMVADQ